MPALPQFKTILCEREGAVYTITLNRPEKLNAFNADMFQDLAHAAKAVSGDRDARAVVIRGSGRAFSSGADLGDLTTTHSGLGEEAFLAGIRQAQDVLDQVEAIPKPTIAAINGHAVGAGLQLAMACDFRIAVKGVKLGLSDVKIGIIPALGATTRLPALIGLARTKELILIGDLITSDRALDIGLVNQVVEKDALDKAVQDLANRLLSGAPLALASAKELLDSGAPLERVAEVQSRLIRSADAMEGMTAFLQKRKPRFSGT